MRTHLARRTARGGRAGVTILETVMAMSMVVLMGATLIQALEGTQELAVGNNGRAALEMQADQALEEVVADLRSSGRIELDGLLYPYVFDGGLPAPAFAIHEHAPAEENERPGAPGFGPDREIVFRMPLMEERPLVNTTPAALMNHPDPAQRVPARFYPIDSGDADDPGVIGDGTVYWQPTPALDPATGELRWSEREVSFTVVTGQDGINALVRREDAGAARIVARHVERVIFDTPESSGYEIPGDSIRVRIYFRRVEPNGTVSRTRREAVVRLRNSDRE
jgi:hypothetical protein